MERVLLRESLESSRFVLRSLTEAALAYTTPSLPSTVEEGLV
jgi:hypothetical protein